MCRFSIPFVVSHASNLFWIRNKQILHCHWIRACVCVSVRQHAIVWVCGIQTTFLVFHWASRTLCMCAVWWNIVLYVWHMCSYNDIHSDLTSVSTVYAPLIRLCCCLHCSPSILLLTQSPYQIHFLKLITNPNANVKCAFTLCWFYMCMRVRMREPLGIGWTQSLCALNCNTYLSLCVMNEKEEDILCKPNALSDRIYIHYAHDV